MPFPLTTTLGNGRTAQHWGADLDNYLRVTTGQHGGVDKLMPGGAWIVDINVHYPDNRGAAYNRRTYSMRSRNWTLIFYAASKGNVDAINALSRRGAVLNCVDSHNLTPLDISLRKEHDNAVEELVRLGASIEIEGIVYNGGAVLRIIGDRYRDGIAHMPQDFVKAATWYRKALLTLPSDPAAQNSLDQLMQNPAVTPQQLYDIASMFDIGAVAPDEAIRWYERARDGGSEAARLRLYIISQSNGLRGDPDAEARELEVPDNEIPDRFQCPLSYQIMRDPVTINNVGHTFERQAILEWARGRGRLLNGGYRNPLTNLEISVNPGQVVTNFQLRFEIDTWLEGIRQQRNANHAAAPQPPALGASAGPN